MGHPHCSILWQNTPKNGRNSSKPPKKHGEKSENRPQNDDERARVTPRHCLCRTTTWPTPVTWPPGRPSARSRRPDGSSSKTSMAGSFGTLRGSRTSPDFLTEIGRFAGETTAESCETGPHGQVVRPLLPGARAPDRARVGARGYAPVRAVGASKGLGIKAPSFEAWCFDGSLRGELPRSMPDSLGKLIRSQLIASYKQLMMLFF